MKNLLFACLLLAIICHPAFADTPKVEVSNVRVVSDDGQHNTSPDLAVFKESFFLAFRSSPDGNQVSAKASIVILSSPDANDWSEVHRFSVQGRDTRSPNFLVFGGKLFVYTATRLVSDPDLNQSLGFAIFSRDGRKWSEPQMLEGTFGHDVSRTGDHRGKAYLCGRRKVGFGEGDRDTQSLMLESDDGLIWRTAAMFQETQGGDTAFLFERDGSVLAVASRSEDKNAQLLRSDPPSEKWRRDELDRSIGRPLLTRWGGRTLVGGENSLSWLDGKRLSEFDGPKRCHPDFLAITATKALVSWHDLNGDGKAEIYLADLRIMEDLSTLSDKARKQIAAADHTLNRQRNNGGWPKHNFDDDEIKLLSGRDQNDTSLDNGSTHRDLRVLAKALATSGAPRFRYGCESGIEFLIEAQYPNGGWPQRYPRPRGYAQHITFNDGAMVGALNILNDVARGKAPFAWCGESLRERAAEAVRRGVDCILNCQVRTDGKLSAWGQQHHAEDLSPAPARTFEPVSLCTSESVGIVRFLMKIENPSDEVIAAIEAAIAWFDGPAKLEGIREKNKVIVDDAQAGPLWSRLYEIGSNRPIFGDRDGKVYYSMAEISEERRRGYAWYGSWPAKLLAEDYPKWKKQR